jgi:hypothetical protein
MYSHLPRSIRSEVIRVLAKSRISDSSSNLLACIGVPSPLASCAASTYLQDLIGIIFSTLVFYLKDEHHDEHVPVSYHVA